VLGIPIVHHGSALTLLLSEKAVRDGFLLFGPMSGTLMAFE
jgi:hypothetical protein